ncbi:MAG: 23S rRNA (pseudouridine(1915)-N(3))-methyltransferase RlmH, partial [Verrucomicrobiota bacterium]
ADGHTDALRAAADFRFSLSKLTLQHELALLLLLEQIYRARAINAGTPYHRE